MSRQTKLTHWLRFKKLVITPYLSNYPQTIRKETGNEPLIIFSEWEQAVEEIFLYAVLALALFRGCFH